jgi:hypothetical protein
MFSKKEKKKKRVMMKKKKQDLSQLVSERQQGKVTVDEKKEQLDKRNLEKQVDGFQQLKVIDETEGLAPEEVPRKKSSVLKSKIVNETECQATEQLVQENSYESQQKQEEIPCTIYWGWKWTQGWSRSSLPETQDKVSMIKDEFTDSFEKRRKRIKKRYLLLFLSKPRQQKFMETSLMNMELLTLFKMLFILNLDSYKRVIEYIPPEYNEGMKIKEMLDSSRLWKKIPKNRNPQQIMEINRERNIITNQHLRWERENRILGCQCHELGINYIESKPLPTYYKSDSGRRMTFNLDYYWPSVNRHLFKWSDLNESEYIKVWKEWSYDDEVRIEVLEQKIKQEINKRVQLMIPSKWKLIPPEEQELIRQKESEILQKADQERKHLEWVKQQSIAARIVDSDQRGFVSSGTGSVAYGPNERCKTHGEAMRELKQFMRDA